MVLSSHRLSRNNAMELFLQRYAACVTGVLSGFDRLVLHGSLRLLVYTQGLLQYLCHHRVRLKDFGAHSRALSDRVIAASLAPVEQARRPGTYLPSSQDRKEEIARQIAVRDKVRTGSLCVLKTVELCRSYEVRKNRATQQIELRRQQRKCLHLYHYLIHPQLGFLHVRLQTWYPFDLQVCLNGREWLSRQLDAAGIRYTRRQNCFTQLEDLTRAQQLFDQQLRAPWKTLLEQLVRTVHPLAREFFLRMPDGARQPVRYYWTTPQTEWASDVMFTSRAALLPIYERLVRHGITTYGPGDVLRFFGRRVKQDGTPWANFVGEISSDTKTRVEGVRIKHRCHGNNLKMYDKGSVLRFETTVYRPRDFRVFRKPEGSPDAKPRWMPLRQSLADLRRRAQICQTANERLMAAQTAVDTPQSLQQLVSKLCRPVERPAETKPDGSVRQPRRFRALNPLADADARLLTAISDPQFSDHGFRNRDLRLMLFAQPADDQREEKRRSGVVSRAFALLRAHHLVKKVSHTHRYLLTDFGRQAITTILAARNANASQLSQLAA